MIPQDREHIGGKSLLFRHGCLDNTHFFRRPAHLVDGQPVECFLHRLRMAHGVHIEYHRPGRFILQRFFQHIVGLPDQLLGSTPDIGGDAVTAVHLHGRIVGVNLAVADKDHIMAAAFPVVLGDHAALHQVGHILGRQQLGHQAEQGDEHQQHGNNRQDRFQIFHNGILLRTGCR